MSSLKRKLSRRFVMLAPLAGAACGFQPAFAPGETGKSLYNRVQVEEPNDQNSYLLTREIEERLGRGSDTAYSLSLTTITSERQLAINREGNTDRFHIVGVVTYTLRDLRSGQIVGSDTVDNFVGYSATGTTVVTLASERDALERLMTLLADQLVTNLLALDLPA